MPLIKLKGFSGVRPRVDTKLLKGHEGEISDNCNLQSGSLRAWRTPKFIQNLAKSGEIKSIYLYDDGATWLHWTDDVDVVRGPISNNTTERTYFTGTDAPRVTDNTIADAGGNDEYPEDSYLIGLPAPTTAPTAALNGTHTSPVNTAYVYTFVNDWGEESAPSPVSNIVGADFSTGSVDLTTMDQAPAGDYVNISKWRIYRVATGTTDADYLFVAEVSINVSSPQYNDANLDSALGEPLPTEGWIEPPSSMIGLTMMGNGIMAGFKENEVYFSVPFIPYAWPIEYQLTTDQPIVAIGAYGNSLVVTTTEYPYIITGTSPESMSIDKLSHRQPCVAKRGLVSVVGGVIYPCPSGLFYIGEGGARMVTHEHYTREEWGLLNPQGMFAAFYDDRYVAMFPSISRGIIFEPNEARMTDIDFSMDAMYADPEGDNLYYIVNDAGTNKLYQFNAGGQRGTFKFRSKNFTLGTRISMSAAKIHANFSESLTDEELAELASEQAVIIANNAVKIANGTDGGNNEAAINVYAVNGDNLEQIPQVPSAASFIFRVFGDGQVVYEVNVLDNKPFRLDCGRYHEYQIEIEGKFAVQEVRIATSIPELMKG
jgi:hypothetical protein